MLAGQRILLTGGAGSIGRALLPRILDRDPEVVRVFDSTEPGIAAVKSAHDDEQCRFLVGDIREKERLARAMEDVDVVIHTAAMKHVDICEYNPFEAVKTNVLGLQNVVDASIDEGVNRVVFTSSDKAVNPANTMGTTKLLGEKLITAGNKYRGGMDIRLSSVRFGNVINSSHSVVPLFREQIEGGGPVTITDARMTRFFLTYDDVFDLLTQAMEKTTDGEVFVYKMPAVHIETLAEAMIDALAPDYGHDPDDVETELVGRRPGETYHELIMTRREANRAVESESLYAIPPESTEYLSSTIGDGDEFGSAEGIVRSSEDAEKLSKGEIVDLLHSSDALDVQ